MKPCEFNLISREIEQAVNACISQVAYLPKQKPRKFLLALHKVIKRHRIPTTLMDETLTYLTRLDCQATKCLNVDGHIHFTVDLNSAVLNYQQTQAYLRVTKAI